MCAHPLEEDFTSSILCKEGEYCFHRERKCFPECMDFPTANPDSCKCYDQWCFKNTESNETKYEDIFCDPESGCYIPEECPQDFTVFMDSVACLCNRILIETNTSFCHENETLPLPTMECPLAPDLAPTDMCICNETMICQPELMCNRVGLSNFLIQNPYHIPVISLNIGQCRLKLLNTRWLQ